MNELDPQPQHPYAPPQAELVDASPSFAARYLLAAGDLRIAGVVLILVYAMAISPRLLTLAHVPSLSTLMRIALSLAGVWAGVSLMRLRGGATLGAVLVGIDLLRDLPADGTSPALGIWLLLTRGAILWALLNPAAREVMARAPKPAPAPSLLRLPGVARILLVVSLVEGLGNVARYVGVLGMG